MSRTIRPGRSAYLRLGVVAGALVLLWVLIWIYRGSQTQAWQPILVILAGYVLWCLILQRRVVFVTDDGISCTYLTRGRDYVAWEKVQRSVIMYWIDRRLYQIAVYKEMSQPPILHIPLRLYDSVDTEFLMSLDRLKIDHNVV